MKRWAFFAAGLAIFLGALPLDGVASRPGMAAGTGQEGQSAAGAIPSPIRTAGEEGPGTWPAAAPAVSAEEAVANLERALKALTTLQARFEQLYFSMSISEPLREKGEVFLEKPDRMRWNYKDPQDKVFLYKEGTLETYLAEDKQLTRSPVSEEALKSDIFGIFLGAMSFRDAFAIEDSPFPTDAARVRQVRLTPKEEGDYSHILLEIDETTWLPRRVIFLEWAGNKREFVFSQVRTGGRIPAKTFVLKVPPGTEIIDDTEVIKRRGT